MVAIAQQNKEYMLLCFDTTCIQI